MTRYSLDLSFEDFKQSLSPDDVLTSVPGLYFSPRSGRVLIVEPESASWLVMPQREFGTLVKHGLLAPGSGARSSRQLGDLVSSEPGPDPDFKEGLDKWLYRLFTRNMLAINGYGYYQPSRLWAVQKYPHYFNIHLTESCNLACRYCRVGDSLIPADMMSVDTCKKIIRRVIEEIPGTKLIIGFHGGEPLLNLECVVEGSKYAREVARSTGKEITLSLQTNGVLLRRYSQLLKELKVEVGVSIDGPAAIHNRYRVFGSGRGSFDEVMAGIQAARQDGLNPGYL
ncbi:MAG: radical SAM protein, partial [Candidatus Saccharicenans sp.]|nr:radical SAM protein [Candidatus Saccharicenans sp.]